MRGVTLLVLCSVVTAKVCAVSNGAGIYPLTTNQLIPGKYWGGIKKPYPTNAWFMNFVLDKRTHNYSDPVNVFPYLVRISPQGINLGYSHPIYYAAPEYPAIISAVYYQFEDQLNLGSVEVMDDYGAAYYHGSGITLQWRNSKQPQKITAPMVQGSPYVTEFFTDATPQLTSRFKWLSVNELQQAGPLTKANRYQLVLALDDKQTQTWILYSENPIDFSWTVTSAGHQLTAKQKYTGWIRLVLQKDTARGVDNDLATLDAYSQAIPLDYKQNYFTTDQNLVYSISWKTQNNKAPLMLSLPHQRKSWIQNSSVRYSGIKGLMLGETKMDWSIELPKIPLLFLEPKTLSPQQNQQIRSVLRIDAEQFLTQKFPDDGPYLVGKRYARAARMVLIAHQLKEYEIQNKLLAHIEALLTQKILEKNAWHFEYDTTWGGIIPSVDDYGSRHYTDHHFHYGYWVYTFAVIASLDSKWMIKPLKPVSFTPKQWVEQLIRDYANKDALDPDFPLQRYQDDYAGHSWASGLTAFEDGQNQQSSSEAVNAYYALALYATAMHDSSWLAWAQFLMTRELVSAQTYWQIQKNSAIYDPKFTEHNQVVATLWGSKVDSNAFFKECKMEYRCGLQYSFGIQMLPFTALSFYLFDKDWLHNTYPTIKKLVSGEYGAVSPAWQWILIKGLIPIMDKNEKEDFYNRALGVNPEDFDNGDSKTNTVYLLAND